MHRKYLIPALLSCLLLSAWFAGWARADQVHDFLVLYSSNVHGEMEPCG
jgi:hypothetical protein